MSSLVRCAFFGLAVFANICGVQANEERPASATPITVQSTTESTTEASIRSSTSPISSVATDATCPSRTINYITHTLAQQCLRADWSRSRGSVTISTTTSPGSAGSGLTEPSGQASQAITNSSNNSDTQTSTGATTPTGVEPTSSSVLTNAEITTGVDAEVESPLDNAKFLSFEDWKKQNLAKAGQSGDNLGGRQHLEPGRRLPNVNALESLGEESEIELDFSGFGATQVKPETQRAPSSEQPPPATDDTVTGDISPASQALRPRDAGKTCKERTNYASFDCAATVLKSNQECKSASSVLVENKDSYMLNKCSASNKYFIVELCNDILIDTVVLANYEFFSSIFRTFTVSVSDRYPAKAEKWKKLGTFEARNTREVQAFLIENPLIWARYLRIEFLTHYGSEYYCPVSLLRVHGTTMMEEFRNQEELARGETQDDEVLETVNAASEVAVVETMQPPLASGSGDGHGIAEKTDAPATMPTALRDDTPINLYNTTDGSQTEATDSIRDGPTTSPVIHHITHTQSTCPSDMSSIAEKTRIPPQVDTLGTSVGTSTSSGVKKATTESRRSTTSMTISATSITSAASSSPLSESSSTSSRTSISTSTSEGAAIVPSSSNTAIVPSGVPQDTLIKDSPQRSSTLNSTRSATSSSQPQPSTQESFFKSISKRLQQLESNSTLSLQYIEEQSKILREAFSKVEKRQISTTTSFLSSLNTTVRAELLGFRQAYDQLWQSTVIELEGQREQHQREMTALSSRLTLVVDELVWQKRMGIVQSTLLLLCLGLVLFARQGTGTFEASLVQQVMARSQAAFRPGTSTDQNSPTSLSPVSLLRRKIPLWRSEPTVDRDDQSLSPGVPDDVDWLVQDNSTRGEGSVCEDDDDGVSDVSLEASDNEDYVEPLQEALDLRLHSS